MTGPVWYPIRRQLRPAGLVVVLLALLACAPPVSYAPGLAPPAGRGCAVKEELWTLGKRLSRLRWSILARATWEQWTGRRVRFETASGGSGYMRFRNFRYAGLTLYLEELDGTIVKRIPFTRKQGCTFTDASERWLFAPDKGLIYTGK